MLIAEKFNAWEHNLWSVSSIKENPYRYAANLQEQTRLVVSHGDETRW